MQVVSVEEGLHLVESPFIDSGYRVEVESVPIGQAYGRVLGATALAQMNYPPFRKSAMDGIVIRYTPDTRTYRIVDTIGAGEVFQGQLALGEGIQIMTGAMVPSTADTVVVKEALTWIHESEVTVPSRIEVGQHIILEGEDIQIGQELLPAGTVLEAEQVGILAGQGYSEVSVYRKPRVIVLTTGREVQDPTEPLLEGHIYNSNRYLLEGTLHALGVDVVGVAHLSDAPGTVEDNIVTVQHMLDTLGPVDMMISTGGVSVGDYDTMPELYERLGANTLYRRLHMRPGAASFGGIIATEEHITWCMGLSGNPTAAMNQFYLLVLPVLERLSGRTVMTSWIECHLGEVVDRKHPLDRYYQGHIRYEAGSCWAYPNLRMTSGGLKSLSVANGLIKIPGNSDRLEIGTLVKVLPFTR